MLAFLIDALGWEQIRGRPFLDPIIRTRCPLRTVLGFSSGAEPSILTGLSPSEHGRWTMYRAAEGRSPFGLARIGALWPPGLPAAARLRRLLAWWVKHREGIRGYFDLYEVPLHLLPHFDLAERDNLFAAGGVPGVETLFDTLERERIPYRSWWWNAPDERNFGELGGALDRGEGGFYFFYSATLDALLHVRGTRAREARELMDDYERRIGAAYGAARERGLEPEVFIFSDHGMTDTVGTIDLMKEIGALGLSMPRDYLAFYDSTMARYWFRTDAARARILDRLAGTEHGRVVGDAELGRLGVLFPDRRYGETVFLMDPGWQIEPSFMGGKANRAMHGFHPDDPGSDAALLTDRVLDPHPGDIRDLHAILLGAARRGAAA